MTGAHRFDWRAGYPSTRMPVFARNIVSASHPLAAQAGVAMLRAGGNAVDAAIAAAAVMTIVEPCSNGIGGDAFCMLWDGERLHGLNASGHAPAAWTRDYFVRKHGAGAKSPPWLGWDSVTVPGAVAGWVALSKRFGRMAFDELLEPAIEIAERGHAVPVIVRHKWAAAAPQMAGQPGWSEVFMPHGRVPEVGELFRFPDAARALRAIGRTQGAALYGGEIAEAAAVHSAANGGAMRAADFAAFTPEWVDPISTPAFGFDVHEMPPNGQGIAALIALGILRHTQVASLPVDGAQSQHLQIEAMKLAFADCYAHVSDPHSMQLTPEQMLDDSYLAARAKTIDPRRAQRFATGHARRGGTIYLTAADESGRMVSFIQSNCAGFGSGVVVPGWGVSMHNRGTFFSLDPHSPNCVAPGRRPFHTIIPGFVTQEGAPRMSFGVMGGNMQPQGHVQTLVRMLAHRQQPQAACDAPRWRFNEGLAVDVERAMPVAVRESLAGLGHRISVLDENYQEFGAGQFIWRLGDPAGRGYVAASDARRDGQAAGF